MKKLSAKILTCVVAFLLIAATPLQALAAAIDCATFDELSNAFASTDAEVNINVTSDISFDGNTLTAKENTVYSIGSDSGKQLQNASFNGSGTVNVNTDIACADKTVAALSAGGDVTVNVTGDVIGRYTGIYTTDNSQVSVTGTASGGTTVRATGNSEVTISKAPDAPDDTLVAAEFVKATDNAHVEINGNTGTVTTEGSASAVINGNVVKVYSELRAYDDSSIILNGEASGISAHGTADVTMNGKLHGQLYATHDATVKVTGDINTVDARAIYVFDNSYVEVEGDVTSNETNIHAKDNSTVVVTGDIVCKGDSPWSAIDVGDKAEVTVNGNVTANYQAIAVDDYDYYEEEASAVEVTVNGDIESGRYGVEAKGESKIYVNGDITAQDTGVMAEDQSQVSVVGDVKGNDAVWARNDSTVKVDGDAIGNDGQEDSKYYWYGSGGFGVSASDNANVHITGDAIGGKGYGNDENTTGGSGVVAVSNATVRVDGNAIGGDVISDPGTTYYNQEDGAGKGAYVWDSATVTIGGNAVGGNGGYGYGALIMVDESGEPGSLVIKGSVTGGSDAEDIYYFHRYSMNYDQAVIPEISVGSYDSYGGRFPQEYLDAFASNIQLIKAPETSGTNWGEYWEEYLAAKDRFWLNVLEQIKATESGGTLTVDAGARTRMPGCILRALQEGNVTLILEWDGGKDIVLTPAFAKGLVKQQCYSLQMLLEESKK